MTQNELISAVYETLIGERANPVAGIENAFSDGSFCEARYDEMREAYSRLCVRLDTGDEDADLDEILSAMDSICAELCKKMFLIGSRLAIPFDEIQV